METKNRVLVLGGDGFCGWATSLHLSRRDFDVTIVDNLSRRFIDRQLGVESLTPISSIERRLAAWKAATAKTIDFVNMTIGEDFTDLVDLLRTLRPGTIIHFAEQRAAPYSMKSPHEARYTVRNNLCATHDVLCAMVEAGCDAHLVHLGTMGVYGYGAAGLKIPEGYLPVSVRSEEGVTDLEILYPSNPGSIYHMTKAQDQLFFAYYNKNYGLRITDLHQGIVWGTETDETCLDESLINRFDYDGDYGTVLNRFLMQAAIGHPLTVHGTGGQTRAFIHIRDSVRCVELATQNPPERGARVNILNQLTETHRLIDLARHICEISGASLRLVPNPRNEAPENDLFASNAKFLALGLRPTLLNDALMSEIVGIARKYAHRCDRLKIPSESLWAPNKAHPGEARAEAPSALSPMSAV